ncbi:acyl-CoA dehydrogenase family protein [Actinoplanes sp. NPDC023936]|uniref:acyl-CoA dehydrogenase family protein n=1 Tax=Actinoplanes sp. NPDC023936 TaxID=3154910 RepID=UPI00340312AE
MTSLQQVLAENAGRADAEASFPAESLAALRGSGLMGLLVPAEYGGAGGTLQDLVRVSGELAGACLSTAMIWAMHCQQVAAVVAYAESPLRDTLLPRIAAGEVYLASVTSERGKGGHLLTAQAPLETDGDELIVRRDAPIVTGALHADGFLITMRQDAGAPPHAVTLVYADRADLKMETKGDWDPLGMRGTHSVAVQLDGTVPATNLIGEPGGFREVVVRAFAPAGHLGWAACWLGAARAALAEVVQLMRSPAGRRQLPSDSPLVRVRLARVRQDLEVAAAFLNAVTAEADAALRDARTAEDPAFQIRLNALKVETSERAYRAVDQLVELVGLRFGYLRGGPLKLERTLRDLRSASLNYANDRLLLANGALTLLDREVRLG